MRGAGYAKAAVVGFLRTALPAHLAAFREELGLSARELPTPPTAAHYHAGTLRALDRWPMIAVSVAGATLTRVGVDTDATGTSVEYATAYSTSVFAWVRAEGWEVAELQRDNLGVALRRLLLDRPHLDVEPLGVALLDDTTLVEDYSENTAVHGERVVSGVSLTFDLNVVELVTRDVRGIVDTTRVLGSVLPHPALA